MDRSTVRRVVVLALLVAGATVVAWRVAALSGPAERDYPADDLADVIDMFADPDDGPGGLAEIIQLARR